MENDERLVIKIYGDATQFESTMKGVGGVIEDAGKAVETASVGIKNNIADATSATKRDFSSWADDVSAKMKSFSDTMGSIGSTLTKVLTIPLVGIGTIAVKGAMEHEDSLGAVEAVYGNASDSIVSSIEQIDSAYGVSQAKALTWSAELGGILQEVGGMSEAEAGRTSVNLIKMAGDMAAMYGTTPEEAYNAIKSGIVGQSRPLQRYGVVADVDMLKSNASESGMWQEGEDFTREMRTGAFLDTFFDQTTKTEGQAERELGNASGQVRSLKVELADLATEVGYQLLPIFTEVVGAIKDAVSWFSNLEEGTQKNIVKFGVFLTVLGPVITILSKVTGTVSDVIGGLGKLSTKAKDAGGIPGMASKIKSSLTPALWNPIAVGATAITAVVAATGFLIVDLWTATKATKELVKATEDSADAFADNMGEVKANNSVLDKSVKRLIELNNQTELTAGEQEEMNRIIGELNSSIPEMNLALDEETGLLNLNEEAVLAYVEAAKSRAELDAIYERQKELQKEEIMLKEQNADAERRMNEAGIFSHRERQKAYNDYIATNKALEENAASQEYVAGVWEETAGRHQLAEEQKTESVVENTTERIGMTDEEVRAYTKATGLIHEDATERQKMEEGRFLQSEYHRRLMGDLNEEELAQLEEYHKGIEAAYNNLIGKAEDFHKKYFNIEQEGIKQRELTADQVKANLDQSNADYAAWAAEMEKLSSRNSEIPEEMLVEFRKLGPEYTTLIQDLNNMTDDELDEFIETWRLSAENAVDASNEELELVESGAVGIVEAMVIAVGEQKPYIKTMGEELGQELYAGILAGIEQGHNPVKTASGGLMIAATTEMARTAEIYSPSKVTTRLGQSLAEGVGVGILNRSNYVSQRAREIMNSAMATMRNSAQIYSPSRVTTEMGEHLGQGLVDGLKSQTKSVAKTADNLMEAAIDGIDGNLEFQKPSLIGGGMDTFNFAGSGLGQSNFKEGDTIIHLHGNYTFREKEEMDYFMNQLELAARRA